MIKTNQGLSGIAKSLKSALTNAPLCKLVLVTTHITKIHGLHLWKDGKTLNKTYVELRAYHAHNNHGKNDKYATGVADLTINSSSPLLTAFRASR